MSILYRNRDYMFTLFEKESQVYLTVVSGGVAQYEVTITVPPEDVDIYLKDENKLIALAKDVATRTNAYEERIVRPSIDPV